MPRGYKIAHTETRQAYAEGRFTDKYKRSFYGRATDGSLHELLAGEDKSRRYREVMEAANGFCQGCASPHHIGSFGEWHHIQDGLSGRCDDMSNARWVCITFHRARHVQVGQSTLEESKSKCLGVKANANAG
jgi:hypothetical protein